MFESRSVSRIRTRRFTPVTARGMLASASAIAAGTAIAVLAAGGTYALWSDKTPLPSATITSGTANLTVSQAAGLDTTGLVPGSSVATTFTASNPGDAKLSVAVKTTTLTSQTQGFASHLSLRLAPVANAAACTAGVAGGAQGTLLGFTSAASPVVIDRYSSRLYCLVATLSPSAPSTVQGGTAAFTLNFEGMQVAP